MGDVIRILLLAAHLLAVNVASAGPLLAAWLASRRDDAEAADLACRLVRWSLMGLVVGGLLGGALLAAPNDAMRAALARFPASTYWFALSELIFSAVCMALMLAIPAVLRRPALAWLFALATASNLLYHFPPLMAILGKLANDPRWAAEQVLHRPIVVRLSARAEILALWTHFTLASVAASAILGLLLVDDGAAAKDQTAASRRIRQLAGAALVASLLQLPAGAWLFAAASNQTREALTGRDLASSASFLAGVTLAIGLLHALATVTFGDTTLRARRRTLGLLVAVTVLMSATLVLSREAAKPRPAATTAQPAAEGAD